MTSTMNASLMDSLRGKLRDRRERLTTVMSEVGGGADLARLLTEVDSALAGLSMDSYGQCEVCGDPVEADELLAHPSTPYCVCKLSNLQRDDLQRDLDLAWRVQAALLPEQNLSHGGWDVHFRYQPAGAVSGDYCDVITADGDGGPVYFLVGDVSGKGVAASFLMAHLSALVRSLVHADLSLPQMVEKINRHMTENTLSSHFATLVCGRAHGSGEIEFCNAGHCLPVVVRGSSTETLDSTGLPVGVDGSSAYGIQKLSLSAGESLVLYTDGVTEARDSADELYGTQSLARVLATNPDRSPVHLADACLRDLDTFRNGAPRSDDLTLMVIRRSHATKNDVQ